MSGKKSIPYRIVFLDFPRRAVPHGAGWKVVGITMADLKIYREEHMDFTVISNLFIDQYMKDANDAQLKVYLYLVRMISAGLSTSVSDMADRFNHTEKDVIRSLKYWEKLGILSLEYEQGKTLTGIRLNALQAAPAAEIPQEDSTPRAVTLCNESIAPFCPAVEVSLTGTTRETVAEPQETAAPQKEVPQFVKPSYTPDQVREFRNRDNTAQLLFIAEQYIGKPLTPSEMKTILFFTDELHFSDDLIDHLLQYCVDKGKKDFKYIEKVAINWAQEGITTPQEARQQAGRYDRSVYTIMNALGKNGSPTSTEMEFITRWTQEYCFSLEIIQAACQRTVLATDRHRFEYAEGILKSWKDGNVHEISDIQRLDELHQKKRASSTKPASGTSGAGNRFNQFTQSSYNFGDLEKQLISNQ